MAFLPLLVGPVSNLVSDVLKRVLPAEKMSEEDRTKLDNEMRLALMKQDWSSVEAELKDRADARQLAAADVARGNAFTNILAATVRPAWGFWSMAIVTVLVMGKTIEVIDPSTEILDLVKEIVKTIIYFYFGGRTIEKALGVWGSVKSYGK